MSAQDYYGQQQGYGYSNQGQQGYNPQAPYSQGQPPNYQHHMDTQPLLRTRRITRPRRRSSTSIKRPNPTADPRQGARRTRLLPLTSNTSRAGTILLSSSSSSRISNSSTSKADTTLLRNSSISSRLLDNTLLPITSSNLPTSGTRPAGAAWARLPAFWEVPLQDTRFRTLWATAERSTRRTRSTRRISTTRERSRGRAVARAATRIRSREGAVSDGMAGRFLLNVSAFPEHRMLTT
ncbi:uncharacterized protein B0T15DRAFT_193064 [Chaetomium strumarium]|uniref:Uncharacterized protein n=1 Tax=Chaetomium strumarium TaxID=1170767 RepID=A0AAJ0GSH4_9PEZI|nr:hypothetical protein B0T15DRAFT_193064 [Chaetomium strumarium]